MITAHNYLLYFVLYAIAVAVPGPGITAIVARALGSGFRATVPAVAGNTVGDLVLMTLSVFGLAVVARQMGGLFLGVKLAGAAYLIWLGYRTWTTPVTELKLAPSSAHQGFIAQLLLTLGNPKGLVFFLALMPSVIDLSRLNSLGYAQLCTVTLILIPSIELAYAGLAAQVRSFLTSAMARKRMNKGAGAIMIGAGVGVAVS
jgi:threonine/homoserine/homoserine lactone efflux protein